MRPLLLVLLVGIYATLLGCPKQSSTTAAERYNQEIEEKQRYVVDEIKLNIEHTYSSSSWQDLNWSLVPQLITETGVDGWIENAIYLGNSRAAFTTVAGVTTPGKQALAEAERYLAEHPIKDQNEFTLGGTFNSDQLLTAGLDLFFVKLNTQQTIMRTTSYGSVIADIRPTTDRQGLFIYEVSNLTGASFGIDGDINIKLLDKKGHERIVPQPTNWFLAGNFGLNKYLLINSPTLGFEDGRLSLKPIPDKVGAIWDVDLEKVIDESKPSDKPKTKDKTKAKPEKTLGQITPISVPINVQVSPDFSAIAWIDQVDDNGLKYFQIMVHELTKPIDYMLYQGRFPPNRESWSPQCHWIDSRRIVTISYRTAQETGTKATIALIVLNLDDPLHPKIIATELIEGPKLIISPDGKYVGYSTIEFSGYGPCFGLRVASTDRESNAGQLLFMSHPSVKLFYPFEWRPDGQAILSEIRVPTPEAGKIKAQLIEFVLKYNPDGRPKPMLAPPSTKSKSTPEAKSKGKSPENPLQRPAEDMITE